MGDKNGDILAGESPVDQGRMSEVAAGLDITITFLAVVLKMGCLHPRTVPKDVQFAALKKREYFWKF